MKRRRTFGFQLSSEGVVVFQDLPLSQYQLPDQENCTLKHWQCIDNNGVFDNDDSYDKWLWSLMIMMMMMMMMMIMI